MAISRETIELAFIVAIQYLPPRQRAVLIARDVVGLPAKETARMLDMSVASVNSALQRARATLRSVLPERRMDWTVASEPTAAEREVLRRYIDASERADLQSLAALLREDVRFAMPPQPGTYVGRATLIELWRPAVIGPQAFGEFRMHSDRRQPPACSGGVRAARGRRPLSAAGDRRAADRGRPRGRGHHLRSPLVPALRAPLRALTRRAVRTMNAPASITITPVFVADLPVEGERMPVYVHVIDHPDARVLVDTGMTELHPLMADMDPRLRPLSEQDFDLAGIDIVVNTHLHADHCGGNHLFAGRPIYVQRRELDDARSEDDYTIREWVEAPGVRYVPVDGELELLPGLRLVPAPGHTPGTQVVVVETGGRPVVVGGDVAVWFGEFDEPPTEGRLRVLALDPELVWLAHEHEPWRPGTV